MQASGGGQAAGNGVAAGGQPEGMPLGQRLYDNWFLLMIAGIVIMAVIYTGWGLWEVAHMPVAELP